MGKQYANLIDRVTYLYMQEKKLKDTRLDNQEKLGPTVGIVFGTGIGGIGATEDAVRTLTNEALQG